MKKYRIKLNIVLSWKILTEMIMMKNTWKSDIIWLMIYLPLEKTLEMCNMAIVIRSVFNDIGSINPSIFRWMFVWIRW